MSENKKYIIPTERIPQDELNSYLWDAAVNLRGSIDAGAYKEYIFPLLFLKRISDVYDEQFAAYAVCEDEEYAAMMMEEEPIKLPAGCHWRDAFNTTNDIGQKLVDIFRQIENANPPKNINGRLIGGLEGVFGERAIWTNKSVISDDTLRSLLNNFNRLTLNNQTCPADEMGTGYEYLVGRFADDAGNTAQEFYTNRTVVELMAEILQLQPGESIYDPTCGSGGMLIKSLDYLRSQGKEWRGVRVYGQELNAGTAAMARMNLYLHGVHDFSIVNANTLSDPAFVNGSRVEQFDVVLANPPYSISQWNREAFMNDKYGRNFLGVPPQGRADYAFIQHIIASMDEKNGRSASLLPHGVLNRLAEKEIRHNLIEADLVEAVISIGKNLFFNSPMEACILICRTKKDEARKGKILLIKATDLVERKSTFSYLTEEHISIIKNIFLEFKEVEGRSKIIEIKDIPNNKYSISPKLYVKSGNRFSDNNDYQMILTNWDKVSSQAGLELNKLIKSF